jgi:hypothetical protein
MSMRARRRGAGRARGERRALRGQSRPSGQLVERRCGGANHRVRSTSRTRRWHRRPRSRRCAAWCSGGVHVVMTNASECRSDFARLEDCGVSVHLYTGTATAPTPSCSSLTAGRRRSARRTCLRGGCRTTGSSERSLSRSGPVRLVLVIPASGVRSLLRPAALGRAADEDCATRAPIIRRLSVVS